LLSLCRTRKLPSDCWSNNSSASRLTSGPWYQLTIKQSIKPFYRHNNVNTLILDHTNNLAITARPESTIPPPQVDRMDGPWYLLSPSPHPPVNSILRLMTVWSIRGKIRTAITVTPRIIKLLTGMRNILIS